MRSVCTDDKLFESSVRQAVFLETNGASQPPRSASAGNRYHTLPPAMCTCFRFIRYSILDYLLSNCVWVPFLSQQLAWVRWVFRIIDFRPTGVLTFPLRCFLHGFRFGVFPLTFVSGYPGFFALTFHVQYCYSHFTPCPLTFSTFRSTVFRVLCSHVVPRDPH